MLPKHDPNQIARHLLRRAITRHERSELAVRKAKRALRAPKPPLSHKPLTAEQISRIGRLDGLLDG
jgi:acetyl-CoA acetyltransferase